MLTLFCYQRLQYGTIEMSGMIRGANTQFQQFVLRARTVELDVYRLDVSEKSCGCLFIEFDGHLDDRPLVNY